MKFSTIAILALFLFITFIGCNTTTAQQYELKEIPNDASCFMYKILDSNQQVQQLPAAIEKALNCPNLVDLTGNILTYMDGLTVKLYDLKNRKDNTMFTMHEGMDGISYPAWSDDNKQVAFVIVNQQKKRGYKTMTRLISLGIDNNGAMISKEKFDVPVNFSCGGICSADPYRDFMYEGNTIKYMRNMNIDERAGEYDQVQLKSITTNTSDSVTNTKEDKSIKAPVAFAKVRKGKLHGVIGTDGMLVIPFQKKTINILGTGQFVIQSFPYDTIVDAQRNVVKVLPKSADLSSYVNKKALYLESNKATIVDESMNTHAGIPDLGYGVESFTKFNKDGLAIVTAYQARNVAKGFSGIVNSDGQLIVPYLYESPGTLQGDLWLTTKEGKYGVVNLNNEIVIPFEYKQLSFVEGGTFKAKKQIAEFDSKFPNSTSFLNQWLNGKGQVFIKTESYDYIYEIYGHPFFKLVKDRQYGLLTSDGKELIAPQYKDIKIIGHEDSYCWVQETDGSWSYFDLATMAKKDFLVPELTHCELDAVTKGNDWYIFQTQTSCLQDEENTYLWKDGELKSLGNFRYVGKRSAGVIIMNTVDKKYILTDDLELIEVSQYDQVGDFEY